MTSSPSPTPTFEIQARVSPSAITKVSRLFNASLDDIVHELLQNARRAGATQVEVDQISDPELGEVIRVKDNGPGIAGPDTLFNLGDSGWDEETTTSEDAAGMGFFSLAGRRVRIVAQHDNTDASLIIEATPDGFNGKEPIIGRRGPDGHRGVTLLIDAKPNEPLVSSVNNAAKFCPIKVTVEGAEVEREDFLQDAQHIETWEGIRIGIWKARPHRFGCNPNTNFHGLTLRIPLPSLSQNFHESYEARIDVESCADLKLVLPARKEVVQNDFLKALQRKIMQIFFERVAQDGPHSLSHKNYLAAKDLGVLLPEAQACLRPFTPAQADMNSSEWAAPEPIGTECLLFVGAGEALDEQNLAWALGQEECCVNLYDPVAAFEGYAWYDAINAVELTGYVRQVGERRHFSEIGECPDVIERPDRLFVTGVVHLDGALIDWQVETDLVLFAEEHDPVDECLICLSKPASITIADLVDFMTRSLFCPATDGDADSYDRQLQWFTDEAEDTAIAYLETMEAVHQHQVERVLRRELYWIVRPSSKIIIEIDGTDIEVHGLETAFTRKTAA